MGKDSRIQWTDHTFSPWLGCSKVSAGCANCYAETLMDTRYGRVKWGPNGTRVATSAAYWKQPRAWNAEALRTGVRRRVFCSSLCDVFEDRHDTNAWRISLLELIELTHGLDWLLLTKRPENVVRLIQQAAGRDVVNFFERNPHVWIGTSVEDQTAADRRIPELLKIPAPVRFLSMEPLLAPVDLSRWIAQVEHCGYCGSEYPIAYALRGDTGKTLDKCTNCEKEGFMVSTWGHEADAAYSESEEADAPDWDYGWRLHWVIVGGESGHGARPMHPDWARSIRDQCQAAGVPFFFKQWGMFIHTSQAIPDVHYTDGEMQPTGDRFLRCTSKFAAGRLLDGREWSDFPTT